MDKKGKIKCDCGTYFEEKEIKLQGITTKAEVCPKCGRTTFNRKQAEAFIEAKKLQEMMKSKRKIIRIGNSIGITLPEKLKEFGLKAGKELKAKVTGPRSFELSF
ncbi:MAG: hypothetical protein ISS25_04465 [Nanoarchaeota archaeon]|nr:hypothetical protein [DPANN group archaeon]MBL7117055.1 hypothetical protein [Nanoarchaeota archaeon]